MVERSTTTPLVSRMFGSKQQWVVEHEVQDQPVAFLVAAIHAILFSALTTEGTHLVRAALVLVLDFVFFSRADSAFPMALEDLTFTSAALQFRETHFKRRRTDTMVNHIRIYPTQNVPQLRALVQRYTYLRSKAYVDSGASPSPLFWQLPQERRPTAHFVPQLFEVACQGFPLHWPGPGYMHHSLCWGGAMASHAINVPLEKIYFWGGWNLVMMPFTPILTSPIKRRLPTPSSSRGCAAGEMTFCDLCSYGSRIQMNEHRR